MLSERAAIQGVLERSGVSHARPDDIDFIISAYTSGIRARDCWKSGGFLEILNDAGRADPKNAWYLAVVPCNHILSEARSLKRASDAGIEYVKMRASLMEAGPCPRAAALNGAVIPIAEAELTPFTSCTHPDQCGCRYQAWLSLMDEID